MRNWSLWLRYGLFQAIVIIAFGAILLRLWDLQIVSSAEYRLSADRNRFRLVPIDAPRGIIYDREGRLLVRNVPSFSVSIVPGGLPQDAAERRRVLGRVGELLKMAVEGSETLTDTQETSLLLSGTHQPSIEAILQKRASGPYTPVRIASNVDRQAAFILEEEHLELPGVLVEAEPLRHYTEGPLLAHILGYMGRISQEELADYQARGYLPDDLVGVAGIERSEEGELRGIRGEKHIEVDAFERPVRVIASREPIPGHNLFLTIDVELQRAVETALREGMRQAGSKVGVAIVMDPRTGEVLAMVSLPSFDNNLFSGGISYEDFASLSEDPRHPLVNHAISGQYPPGSTFKIVTAAAALESGVINRNTHITCEGTYYVPNRFAPDDPTLAQPFRCWRESGHGSISVVTALAQSCNIFFGKVAGGFRDFPGLGVERLAAYGAMFGFGEPTGIGLPGEAAGLLPSDQWKRQHYGESWYTGDTYNAAIGQGFVLATPLQMLNAVAAVANGGTLYRPQIIYRVEDVQGNVVRSFQPDPIRALDISPQNMAIVREGLRQAAVSGTAYGFWGFPIEVAGKTGTAEYYAVDDHGNLILDSKGRLPTHAWFAGFAPYNNPEIALVVFLEGGGEGSQKAVPVAVEIMRHYFGIPKPEPTPTPTATAVPLPGDEASP